MGKHKINKVDKETGKVTGSLNIEVRAFPIAEPKGAVKGYANVNIDDVFALNGLSIREGKNGLFVSMPQTRDGKGDYRDIFHPTTTEGRNALQSAVLTEFGIALDDMVASKESALNKIREAAAIAKQKAIPTVEGNTGEKTVKKSQPER